MMTFEKIDEFMIYLTQIKPIVLLIFCQGGEFSDKTSECTSTLVACTQPYIEVTLNVI